MPSARKNVKFAVFVSALALILFALTFTQIGVALAYLILFSLHAVGYYVAAVLFLAASYLIFRSNRVPGIKKKVFAVLSLPLIGYACISLYVYLLPTEYSRCDYYTKALGGGAKEVNGSQYTISLCGTGSDKWKNDDEVRLQVFSQQGDLLASRHFVINSDTSSAGQLDYEHGRISIYDRDDNEKIIAMPPSAWERIRARLPLFQ